MNKFLFGADPEIALTSSHGFVSAIGLIGGTKNNPLSLGRDGHAVLEDNVAVEFNIPACGDVSSLKNELHFAMQTIKERFIPAGVEYSLVSAASFPDEQLNCPDAWIFGCDPDFDAWNVCQNPKPKADDKNLRSFGGHIHVGSDVATEYPLETIRAMDIFLGLESVKLDDGVLRRKLYGKAGAFRIKPYGVEYRTLSNFWIFKDELIEWAYQGVEKAIDFVQRGGEISSDHAKQIQEAINTSNLPLAMELRTHYG